MKNKYISAFLSAVMSISAIGCLTASAGGQTHGDVNSDGRIDGVDASNILTAYAKSSVDGGSLGYTDEQKRAADVNSNGIVDGVDASLVLTYYAKTSVGYTESLEFFINNGEMPLDPFGSGLESDIDADRLLGGSWEFLSKGDPLSPPAYTADFFNYDREFRISMDKTGIYGTGYYETSNYFDTPRGCYNLLRNTEEMNIKLSPNSPEMHFGGMIDTHFTAANVDGAYIMAISVIGNGISVFDQILGPETQAADGIWILRKNSNETHHIIDDTEMASLREKGTTFYAYRWLDLGSEVYLQTVNAETKEVVLDDGMPHEAMFFSYANNGHALTAVRYNVKDAKEKADPGTYKPALVKVRTDSSGNVTELEEVPKYDYGYYHVF